MNRANPIILFDGICNLCTASVQFIIKRDHEGIFKFGSLQSEPGQSLLKKLNLPADDFHSLILVEGERYYLKSAAAIRVARRLDGLWSLLGVLIIVPKPIMDVLYDVVARNRYRWFGKRDECMVSTPDIKRRFLE